MIKVAWRAIGDRLRKDYRSRGVDTNGRYSGVIAAFERYWYSTVQPAPAVEDRVVERTALWQIWERLSPLHKGVLAALAMYEDYSRAAAALGKPVTTFTAQLARARREFLALWHEGEVPSRPWGTDRRKGPDSKDRHSVTNVIKLRERRRGARAEVGDVP